MITDEYFDHARPHFNGIQRIYKFENGYSLSAVNSSILHVYKFAWEIAVLRDEKIVDTPLTNNVIEVFKTDEDANMFIHIVAAYANTDDWGRLFFPSIG